MFNLRHLLIVDDEEGIVESISDICKMNHIPHITAKSGEEAWKILESEPITAVLSDLKMPEGDGASLLLKTRMSGNPIPFAFLTAFNSREYIHEALQLGASAFLTKPFRPDEVEKLIYCLLDVGATQLREVSKSAQKKRALYQANEYIRSKKQAA